MHTICSKRYGDRTQNIWFSPSGIINRPFASSLLEETLQKATMLCKFVFLREGSFSISLSLEDINRLINLCTN